MTPDPASPPIQPWRRETPGSCRAAPRPTDIAGLSVPVGTVFRCVHDAGHGGGHYFRPFTVAGKLVTGRANP